MVSRAWKILKAILTINGPFFCVDKDGRIKFEFFKACLTKTIVKILNRKEIFTCEIRNYTSIPFLSKLSQVDNFLYFIQNFTSAVFLFCYARKFKWRDRWKMAFLIIKPTGSYFVWLPSRRCDLRVPVYFYSLVLIISKKWKFRT